MKKLSTQRNVCDIISEGRERGGASQCGKGGHNDAAHDWIKFILKLHQHFMLDSSEFEYEYYIVHCC